MGDWALPDISDATGGNAGLGFASARELAGIGAEVAIAGRRPNAAGEAVSRVRRKIPYAAWTPMRGILTRTVGC